MQQGDETKSDKNNMLWRHSMRVHAKRAGALLSGLMFPTMSLADWTVNMTPGVTGTSNEIFDLHMAIFWICVAIGVVVFGIMFWSIFAYRKSKGHKAANFHRSEERRVGKECRSLWAPGDGGGKVTLVG